MSDEYTPTRREPIDTFGAQLAAFRKDPSAADLFLELYVVCRKSGNSRELAELCELRAPHEANPLRAAQTLADGGAARLLAGDLDQAERDFRKALSLDPIQPPSNDALVALLIEAKRFADAAKVVEREIEALEQAHPGGEGAERKADRHRRAAELWESRLGRLDRALHHWQRAYQLEPRRTEALTAARRIYGSLGKDEMVAQLYQAEIDVARDREDRPTRAALELELGRLLQRQGKLEAAAQHLEAALEIDPAQRVAREALAEVYASPVFAGHEDTQIRAGELFVELGQERMVTEDRETAINYMRRALGVNPYSRAGTEGLEQALSETSRWEEVDRLYRHRLIVADDKERKVLLAKRADLLEHKLHDREELKRCLEELAVLEPPGGPTYARLRQLYAASEDWRHLALLVERELEGLEDDPVRMVEELLELATLTREHLGDRDRAAELLHRVLSYDPKNAEALARYGDHFRERRDWRGLADLTEFAIENAREAGESASQLVHRLEELAQLAEVRLGDAERAISTWRRIEELEPGSPRANEALRRLMSRAKMWDSLVGMLEQEAQAAVSPEARAEALRRIAQVYRERQVNPRRAITLYEEILTLVADDEPALKALGELYEREGDDAGLASTIRRQLDLDLRKLLADLEISGKRAPTAREWPVAKRVERLTALRRLALLFEQKLADVEGVVFACAGILEILPGDRDALDRMERVLDKAGDVVRLEQILEYHASSATGPAEKAKVIRRLAKLGEERGDEAVAMERWELVLKAVPSDGDALDALATLYERHGRWGELAVVLERGLLAPKPPEPGSPAAAKRAADIKRYARVVDDKLGDPTRATKAWRRVLEVLPRDRDGLEALARLHEQQAQWRELAEVLERQTPLYVEDEPRRAAEVALARARLLEERLGAPGDAIKALEALVAEVDPANLPAHQSLRRLYEARGDFEAAVRVAEREMYLTDEPARKIARGLEIGLLCRDRLGDAPRALLGFERVLALAPDHEEALAAAAELYAQVGDFARHVQVLERRILTAGEDKDRRGLMLRIARVTAEKLADPATAFAWYRRAHEHSPDGSTMAELRRAAEAFGLWRELAEVYEGERTRVLLAGGVADGKLETALAHRAELDVPAFVAACRELAGLAERRLDDRLRAMVALHDALTLQPDSDELLAECERVAREGDDRALWHVLLDCFERPLAAQGRARRVELLVRRAELREQHLADPAGASEDLLRAFASAPDDERPREALHRLAERTGGWTDVVAVEAARYERALALPERLELLRRRAAVLEDKVASKARAFRCHLAGFFLAPEDPDTIAHLWRLGREIGSYAPADRQAAPEPAPAYVEAPPPERPGLPPLVVESSKPGSPRRDATQELSMTDLVTARAGAPPPQPGPRRDRTMPLAASDLLELRRAKDRSDPTMEIRTEDLIESLGALRRSPPPPPPGRPRTPVPRAKGPPPPPPPPPQIRRQVQASGPRLAGVAPSAIRQPLAAMPSRSFDSPWEELATAYELLPAADEPSRLRWQFLAAEVWESGAGELGKAFDVLARTLQAAPDDAEPRARLHRLARQHGAWDRLAELYEAAAERADSPALAAGLLLDVAEIRGEQGRSREMEAALRQVLGMRPDDGVARDKLEALLRSEGRAVDLAASLEERTDPRLGSAAPLAERPGLLRELAALYADKLGRPHDAVDVLERLRQLEPDDLELLGQLADLLAGIGRWSKVIEVLARVADLAEGAPEGREALRRIGHIYEHELELPDRAIDAYSQLLVAFANDADAFAALDRLYGQHARWRELDDILRRRAALSREPDERADLLRRRAQILFEWLDSPDEAAAALRHARTIKPDDPALADELVAALVQAHKGREAGAVLEGRIASLRQQGAATGDVAALLIRLAGLRADSLGDPDGAQKVLREALELVPDHPTALATLARLAETQKDPRTFAEAKLREAEVLGDVDAKIAALLAAGTALRDQVGDITGARRAFERVLELRRFHAEATWALAGLVEQAGDLETAAQLLEARLSDEGLDGIERAQLYTQLAALSRQAGVDAAAERRLDEALEVVPDHMPAILARADLLAERGEHGRLVGFLVEIVPQLEAKPPETRAELLRRLALAHEQLNLPEDAYQTLLEADRLHRGNLLVKLALGENRYRARRWREAALHLSSLASHAQAELHPAEVAEGLYHAALAEIRSLHPEKAAALYERAIALKPNYAPALHALAELAMEKGDAKRAIDLLTRQASATDDAAERLRLFEALGDMAQTSLKDQDRARLCFEAAVNAAEPLESRHVPLLHKLLGQQQRAGDQAGAARTGELLSSFAADAGARAGHLREAAENYLAAGQSERARAAAERAVAADPHDLDAVSVLTELTMQAGDHEQTAQVLGRALSSKDKPDEVSGPRQALLWARLGEARGLRGDGKRAITAYQQAIVLAPDSDGAMTARRRLLELWQGDADRQEVLVDFRRVLAADSLELGDVVAYARSLCQIGDADAGRVFLELATAMGHAPANEDVSFLALHPARQMAEDEAYRGTLDADARAELILDEDDEPLAAILGALAEAAPILWSNLDELLARHGLGQARRVGATTELPAATLFTRIARALDAPATVLYTTDASQAPDVQVVCVAPPVVVLGPRLLGRHDALSDLEVRFLLARAAELARPERIIAAGMPAAELGALLAALVRLFGKPAGEAPRPEDEALRTSLPVRVRSQLEKLFAGTKSRALDVDRYLEACQRAADRAGLLLGGDLETAVRHAGGRGPDGKRLARHLFEQVLRRGYLAARHKLGIGAVK